MYFHPYWEKFAPIDRCWHMMAMVFHVFLFITGLIANLLVIIYYFKFEKFMKIYDYLLVNLMVADLFIIVTNLPMAIVSCYYGEWIFGQMGCNIYALCGTISGLVGISTMTLISIERLLVIKRPFKVLRAGKKTALCYVIGAWVYGVGWSLPPLFTDNQFVLEGFKTSCTYDYLSLDNFNQSVLVSMNVCAFFIPILIMISSYSYILYSIKTRYDIMKVKNFRMDNFVSRSDLSGGSGGSGPSSMSRRKSTDRRKSVTTTSPTGSIVKKPYGEQATRKDPVTVNEEILALNSSRATIATSASKRRSSCLKLATELKITKNTIVIILVFCLAWFPYAVITLIAQYSSNREKFITPVTTIIPVLLAKLSTLLNPLIYVIKNKQFMSKFRKSAALRSKRSSVRSDVFKSIAANLNNIQQQQQQQAQPQPQ